MILEFICEILPGILAAYLADSLLEQKMSARSLTGLALLNIIGINLVCLFFSYNIQHWHIAEGFTTPIALRYLICAFLLVPLAGFAEACLLKYFRLRLKAPGEDKD